MENEVIPVEWIMKHADETEAEGMPNVAEAFRGMVRIWRDEKDSQTGKTLD